MKEYKPLILFLLKFLGSYIAMIFLYNLYLEQTLPDNKPDSFTIFTSDTTSWVMNTLGYHSQSVINPSNPYCNFYLENQYTTIINEGCNAISVMIIFIAFIVAFSTKITTTIWYILVGLILLFVMNITRIAIINWIVRYMPEYAKMAHDYLFPAIIYGTIVVLWIVWVKYFVLTKKKNDEQVA